jgi:diguanylate cyclase (GGDEF)-like protein
MIFILLFIFIILLFTFEDKLSYEKIDNLYKQKALCESIYKQKTDDKELALIQLNGLSTEIYQSIDKLKIMYKLNISDKYILGNKNEYLNDLKQLEIISSNFTKSAKDFYTKQETKSKEEFKKQYINLNSYIDTLLIKENKYGINKFNIFKNIMIAVFLILLIVVFIYKKRINDIYKDIEYLYQIDKKNRDYTISTIEADAILLRMQRKSTTTDNPTMIDPVTNINNYKGMINSYSLKKNLKDNNFTGLTVIEINNFSKNKRVFSQETTQAILKKIAYTISLHEQPIDVIARTDYNQFTIIFSRNSKEQAFKDTDLIRQSIEELKFNTHEKGIIHISISGGFILKPNNMNIEEGIKQAKEILLYAKAAGTNKILQIKDIAHADL